jgi:hypothetical protein
MTMPGKWVCQPPTAKFLKKTPFVIAHIAERVPRTSVRKVASEGAQDSKTCSKKGGVRDQKHSIPRLPSHHVAEVRRDGEYRRPLALELDRVSSAL